MICRMWHGITPRSKGDAYAALLEQRALSGYRAVPGNLRINRGQSRVFSFGLPQSLPGAENRGQSRFLIRRGRRVATA